MTGFLDNLREYLKALGDQELKKTVAQIPINELIEIWDDLEEDEELKLFRILDLERKVDLMDTLPISKQELLIRSLTRDHAKALLAEMDPDDLADFIQSVSPEVRESVWNALGNEAKEETLFLLKYDYDDAAGLMTTRYLAIRPNLKVSQALSWVRRNMQNVETVYYIYVLDPLKRLIGVVSLRDLMSGQDDDLVQNIMVKEVITVFQDTDQEEVAKILETYDLLALPVVDRYHRLLGIVTFDDIIDVIREEQTEDIYRMSAVSASRATYLESSVFALMRRRIPWLIVLLLAATITTNVIAGYRHVLEAAVVLAFFIPIVTGTGGNSGTQSATLMIRGLATGELRFQDVWRIMGKEILVGLLIGVCLGILTVLRAMLLPPEVSFNEALAVGTAMCFVVIVATLVGALAPLIISRLGMDPTVMAGPLMATLIDVSGLTIYFETAKLLLRVM
ncbi:MAG: magnesium transporter [Spirochaetales bacterium]|nr:magnesium transporter [Spirochaetales bacterium]